MESEEQPTSHDKNRSGATEDLNLIEITPFRDLRYGSYMPTGGRVKFSAEK
jgi:hypothetical protein